MSRPTFTWQIHWPTTLFVFAVLPCLLALGVWQWHRADEKREVQRQYTALLASAPLDATRLQTSPANYTRVVVRGRYDNARNWLLDNRVQHGRVGYEVLTAFLPANNGPPLLINRGWIAGNPARQILPSIPEVNGDVTLQGYAHHAELNQLLADENSGERWPRVIAQIDLARMDDTLRPWTLRLDANAAGALQPEWPVVTGSPEKHIAYAVQWFAMAVVLLVLWLLRSSNFRVWLSGSATPRSE